MFLSVQASSSVIIPKEHHRWILGKSGTRLKELEKATSTKITVPSINDQSDKITVTGTKEGIEKALHEMHIISDEQVFVVLIKFSFSVDFPKLNGIII
jgi:predicted PilT family ATPase